MEKRLLISLEPFNDECLSSYIARLTIENSYTNLNWICENIGTTRNELLYIQPNSLVIKELSKITGVSIYKLNKLTYTLEFKFYGRLMRIDNLIDRNYGKICPQCLRENFYHRKMWNYKPVKACHKHKCLLVRKCTACGKPIPHYRNNMEMCSCGKQLTELYSKEADIIEINYSMLVYQKINEPNEYIVWKKNPPGFVNSLSLEEILYRG